ncbi:MAG: hypothetical protein QMC52_04125 [Candidatus Poseidoniaceae archaeon]|jgi:hypothetical protein
MRRGLVALYLLSLMLLAGCLSPTTAGWGQGDGEVKVDFSIESTSATSSLGDEKESFDQLLPVGCNETRVLDNGGSPVKFTGYMAASHFYETHDQLNGAKELDLAVTVSVAIKSMSMNEAVSVDGEQIPRVQVKNWNLPLYPETGAGNIDLDEVDMDSSSKWFVLGLIPTTENILYGMQALGEWHQPIQIEGYLVDTNKSITAGYYSSYHEVNDNCEMKIGQNNIESVYLMVTSIKFEDSVITSNGGSSDEWVLGDVPMLGRGGFIMFLLIAGIGGAVTMFMLSKIAVAKGASHSMEVLVGKKAMAAVSRVKSDMKQARSAGMKSSTQRNAEARQDASTEAKKEGVKPAKKQTVDSPSLAGFDLDSALQSGPSESITSEFGSKSSSAVATTEAKNIASQATSIPQSVTQQRSIPVTSAVNVSSVTTAQSSVISNTEPTASKRSHFSSSVPRSSKPQQQPQKKVVKKRATKKAQQPEPETWTESKQETTNSPEEEEEFSDFSF